MGVKLIGFEKLEAKLTKNMDMSAVKTVVKKNGAEMQKKAMKEAPVLTHHLQKSIILADIKKICRSIEHTAHYAWNMQRPTQRILPDNTTKQPLLMGILEVAFKFS